MSRENLQKLGELAGKAKGPGGLVVSMPKQADVSYIWKGASIHPMQALQNVHHRTVREALRPIEGDEERRDVAGKQLGAFFYFDSASPKLLPAPDSVAGDNDFLDERIADAKKKLMSLSRVARQLDEFEDPAKSGETIVEKLREQVAEMESIIDAIPNAPESITEVDEAFTDFDADLLTADPDDSKELSRVAGELMDAAGTIENVLLGHCCLANFHIIDTFYLFRLLVKYRFHLDQDITSDLKSDVSSAVTGLLHNGKDGATKWITDWLTAKLVELNRELMKIDGPNLFFYLKGGRALEYLLGSPEQGQNDFDTGIIINPNLPPSRWYELFRNVYNLCLRHLRKCKYEFIGLLATNKDAFDAYVQGLDPKPSADDGADDQNDDSAAEAQAKLQADLLMQLDPPDERASGKAELIDIGIPRRDTPEVWETWGHKPHAKTGADGMVYPGPLYYIAEYATMIREALQPGSRAAKKSNKRIIRLSKLVNSDKTDAAVAHEIEDMPADLLPKSVAAVGAFGLDSKVVKVFLTQLAHAHLLLEDAGFVDKLDTYIAEQVGKKDAVIKLPPDFAQSIGTLSGEQQATAKTCGFVEAIGTSIEKHIRDRGEFFRRNRKEFSRFVKAIYTASIFNNQAEDLELMFCVAGSFAARLHAEYADYEHIEDIEPFHRVDLRIFCKPEADPEVVLDVIGPGFIDAYKNHPDTPEYPWTVRPDASINLYWPLEETMGEFSYRPLAIRLKVEKRPEGLPQLAFIWGYPVLGLRDLVWDYIKECGHTEEMSARTRLSKTANALTDILSKFENPGAEPIGATAPTVVAVVGAGDGAVVPQPQPPKRVTGLARVPQAKANWCWAAVSEMMRRLYGNEAITQQLIVQDLYNNQNDQQGPLKLTGITYVSAGQGVTLSWDDVKREIDADKPFIFATGQHYMVATGYKEQGASRLLLYWDPLPTNRGADKEMTYESYRAAIRGGGATYHGFSGPGRA